ncbi:MAG: hypothetical protein HY901_18515, partial [Deltaproteobacteria bacterium]|nr:hypothetical protein [Deltaproteobacteria bacterium]
KGMAAHLLLYSASTSRMAEAGPDGIFAMTGLGAGTYRLTALPSRRGLEGKLSQEVELPEGGEVQTELRERSGGATVTVTVEPKLRCTGGLVGATLGWGELPYMGRGAVGVITFRGIPAGNYRLAIHCLEADKKGQQSIEVTAAPEQSFEVTVE